MAGSARRMSRRGIGRSDPWMTKPLLSRSTPPRWRWRRRGSRGPRPVPGEQRRERRRASVPLAGSSCSRLAAALPSWSRGGGAAARRAARRRLLLAVLGRGGGGRRCWPVGEPRRQANRERERESGVGEQISSSDAYAGDGGPGGEGGERVREFAARALGCDCKLLALNAACEAPFRQALASLLRRVQDVACAVVDGQCYAALSAAGQLGVPVLALRTDSAAALRNMLAYPRLRDAGYLPIKEEQLDELVPDLEPLRVRDLIRVDGCDTDEMCSFVARVADAVGASVSGIVINTLEAMEASELAKIRRELSLPAFAIGPLHLLSSQDSAEQSLYTPDVSCRAWLDAHPARSVLYVSLGSLACVDRGVFEEMAWGLAGSGVPFLWVVRPGLVSGSGGGAGGEEVPPLPDGFSEEIRNRGKIVSWAPQREVLAHAAIAAFWTHCGWNSILESVCEGVPMLVQPCFADQIVNARYVTHEWGVGLEVGEVLERESVAKVVTKVMVGEDGPLMRERAHRLQTQACAATSSAMDGLVQYVLSL